MLAPTARKKSQDYTTLLLKQHVYSLQDASERASGAYIKLELSKENVQQHVTSLECIPCPEC
jgi:hypothetical protein